MMNTQQHSQQHSFAPQHRVQARSMSNMAPSQGFSSRPSTTSTMQDSYYAASFQKHYSQLGKLTPPFCPPLLVELCSS
jgi:hypothetical protein